MGRLGAGEMSYNSDLDLIFVYHDRGEAAEGSHVAASRIVQKFIVVLEARTREGYAYKIDLRLRPSGNAGPLVASLDGFRDYHRTSSSAVWERQALVRARRRGRTRAGGGGRSGAARVRIRPGIEPSGGRRDCGDAPAHRA